MKKIMMIVALVSLICGIAYADNASDYDAGTQKEIQQIQNGHLSV